MQITEDVYRKMLGSPICPPETGGILGGNNNIIDHIAKDRLSGDYDSYSPDTAFLNDIIAQWAKHGINFMGLFHTHFRGGTELSNRDRRYIDEIMKQTDSGTILYFPIVIPDQSVILYSAKRKDKTLIMREELLVVNGGEKNEKYNF